MLTRGHALRSRRVLNSSSVRSRTREFLEKPHPFQVGFNGSFGRFGRMNPKRAVKVIKNGERKDPDIQAEVESAAGPNKWSIAVQSWVVEHQERDLSSESTPTFDSLFKDALPE